MFAKLTRDLPGFAAIGSVMLATCVGGAGAPARGDGDAAVTRPVYPRAVVRRGPARLPDDLASMPESLRPAVARTQESDQREPRSDRHAAGTSGARVERVAEAEALREAERRTAAAGRRELYRAGFHRGLRAATDATQGAEWELEEGRRQAFHDPDARRLGREQGANTADELSRDAAAGRVAEQFRDLSREPRFVPWPVPPGFTPAAPPIPAPTLEETFAAFPWSGFTALGARYQSYLAEWSYDPWSLRRCDDPAEFLDPDWADPGAALERWRATRAASTIYRDLDAAGRADFRAAFERAFRDKVRQLLPTQLQSAFEAGLADGWSYGWFVGQEWNFRRGYHRGYLEAHADAAAREYDRSYPVRYAFWYADAWAGWSERPHPEVASMTVRDADDDGVFEPGEQVLVDYGLVNYGGAGGPVTVFLDGPVLERSARGTVELPARGRAQDDAQVVGTIDVRAPLGETRLSLVVGEDATDLPLQVAHPLRFEPGSLQTRRDNLAGRVTLQIDVTNQSRRPVGGRVDLRRSDASPLERSRPLPEIAPGASAPVVFELAGLEPLDLIGGRVRLELAVRGDGVEHDGVIYRVPDTVRDLASRDLPQLIRRQAHDGATSDVEIATARDLLLERLREDWRVAATGKGNPYKKDLRRGGTRTALGELVELCRRESVSAVRPEVFEGLSSEILQLADVLPGAHPLLRKYVRRLALELP
jgi:hypothetical protein